MERKKKDARFSNAWTTKDGKPKKGVKIHNLKNRPAYVPQEQKEEEQKEESPLFGKPGRNDK